MSCGVERGRIVFWFCRKGSPGVLARIGIAGGYLTFAIRSRIYGCVQEGKEALGGCFSTLITRAKNGGRFMEHG